MLCLVPQLPADICGWKMLEQTYRHFTSDAVADIDAHTVNPAAPFLGGVLVHDAHASSMLA